MNESAPALLPLSLERLLGNVPVADFLQEHYQRLPFVMSGRADVLTGYGSLLSSLIQGPQTDIVVGRRGTLELKCSSLTVQELKSYLAAGQTVGLRHVHQCDPLLAESARQFARELGGDVDIHLYCTPAEGPGFGWHYDAEEVFILQLAGIREWNLRKNTVHPWPLIESLPADQHYEREIMPVQRCRLIPGDWLYIPSGYWHRGQAEQLSISLSVGVRPLTAIDLLDHLRRRLVQQIEWRQRLPPLMLPSPDRALRTACHEMTQRLASDLNSIFASDEFLASFLDCQRKKYTSPAVSNSPPPCGLEI